jgi:hypothetical protein
MINWIGRLRKADTSPGADWQKLAGQSVAGNRGQNQFVIRPDRAFQTIKLRSLAADLIVHRWILEFHDGTILNLAVTSLLEGSESKPLPIPGRRLTKVVVRYDATKVTRRGRLEIWAQPCPVPA